MNIEKLFHEKRLLCLVKMIDRLKFDNNKKRIRVYYLHRVQERYQDGTVDDVVLFQKRFFFVLIHKINHLSIIVCYALDRLT